MCRAEGPAGKSEGGILRSCFLSGKRGRVGGGLLEKRRVLDAGGGKGLREVVEKEKRGDSGSCFVGDWCGVIAPFDGSGLAWLPRERGLA